jgi:hypothetical protein
MFFQPPASATCGNSTGNCCQKRKWKILSDKAVWGCQIEAYHVIHARIYQPHPYKSKIYPQSRLCLAECSCHSRNNSSAVGGQAAVVTIVLHIWMKGDLLAILQHSFKQKKVSNLHFCLFVPNLTQYLTRSLEASPSRNLS